MIKIATFASQKLGVSEVDGDALMQSELVLPFGVNVAEGAIEPLTSCETVVVVVESPVVQKFLTTAGVEVVTYETNVVVEGVGCHSSPRT